MMQKTCIIHITRHGQVNNPDSIFYERLPNFHLSDIGVNQANNLGKKLINDNIGQSIQKIYSSPQLRANETAYGIINGMKSASNTTIKFSSSSVETLDDFDEIQSPLAGQPISKLNEINWNIYNEDIIKDLLDVDTSPPFENFNKVFNRTINGIKSLSKQSIDSNISSVLVTTHGACCLSAKLWAQGKKPEMRAEIIDNDSNYYPLYCSVLSLTIGYNGNLLSYTEIKGYKSDNKKV